MLTTLDPNDCVQHGQTIAGIFMPPKDPSGINAMLLVADLERGKREAKHADYRRIHRNIEVATEASSAATQRAVCRIKSNPSALVACDIECSDPQSLLCIGFAISPTEAYVFAGEAIPAALEIVADPSVRKIFQNGQFDAYFLKTRCGVEVASWTDDCMIAWHALWPEIAGKGKSKSKRTKKSLAFLASLYTESPEWWKDYETDEAGMYELNGRDCCITYEIMENLRQELEQQGVMAIYRHEMSMMPVLVAIQERGLAVDDAARQQAIDTLQARSASIEASIRAAAEPLLRERSAAITKPHLFFGKKRCSCCKGGKVKAAHCWSCAGLDMAPRKRDKVSLGPCVPCGGVGSFPTFDFNPASTQQQVELFYNVLGLPKRYNDGSISCDEKAFKSLLAEVA